MKNLKIGSLLPILILSITLGFSQTDPSYPQPNDADDTYFDDDTPEAVASVSYEPFYDDLSPHGTWTTYDDYGYVWIPRAEAGFQPYSTNGHWVMTDYGWTWASDYSWGWAAFHYGRWTYAPRYGWMWIPGRTWGPAWVSWRQSNDYYGWAPLGPRRRGVNVAVVIPVEHYRFVPVRYMANPQLRNYVVNRQQNGVIINNTTVINTTRIVNKTRIVAGPPREQFERTTGQKVDVVVLKENNHARAAVVNNGQMEVYRPQMSPLRNNAAPPQPLKVEAIKDVPQRVTKRQPPTMQPREGRNTEGGNRAEKTQPNVPTNNEGQKRLENVQQRPVRNNDGGTRPEKVQQNRVRNNDGEKRSEDMPQHPIKKNDGEKRLEQPRNDRRKDG